MYVCAEEEGNSRRRQLGLRNPHKDAFMCAEPARKLQVTRGLCGCVRRNTPVQGLARQVRRVCAGACGRTRTPQRQYEQPALLRLPALPHPPPRQPRVFSVSVAAHPDINSFDPHLHCGMHELFFECNEPLDDVHPTDDDHGENDLLPPHMSQHYISPILQA
jgi:hypothetical protein